MRSVEVVCGATQLAWLPLMVAVCFLPSCENRGRANLCNVNGRLLVGNRPAANAQIAFHRIAESTTKAILCVGTTGADGSFQLTTYKLGDGAPAGEYVVTAIWPDTSIPKDECVDVSAHDRFNGRYSDPGKSQLRATVRLGVNEVVLRAALGPGTWSLPRPRPGDGTRT